MRARLKIANEYSWTFVKLIDKNRLDSPLMLIENILRNGNRVYGAHSRCTRDESI